MKRLLIVTFLLFSRSVFALDLELTQGMNAAYPIGIETFSQDRAAQELQRIIAHDFALSGQFKLIASPKQQDEASLTIEQWRYAGADSVVVGSMEPVTGGNKYRIHFELINAAARGKLLLSKNYEINSDQLRALAHQISDEVYEKLTGIRGIFSTRIAYILVRNERGKTVHSLEIADVDGYNPKSLVVSDEPLMSPAWSPDGKRLAFVSFEKKRSQIYTIDVASGRRRLITMFPGINGAPTWSPDGKELAIVLSKAGSPDIYRVNLETGALSQMTFGRTIDTEPRYSPDGKYLLFTSNRGGSPQIYRLTLEDGSIKRISFDGNYNARASYTPNEDKVVLLHRTEDREYVIGVQSLSASGITPLTDSIFDESPTLSPNGKLVLYATRKNHQGVLAMVSLDGRIKLNLPSPEGDAQEPAWSPYF